MKYSIRNNTTSSIIISGVSFTPNIDLVIFDSDLNIYKDGLHLMKTSVSEVVLLISKGDMTFKVNDSPVDVGTFHSICLTWNNTLQGKYLPYTEDNNNIFFNLQTAKLCVFSPLTNKWYSVQMTEDNNI